MTCAAGQHLSGSLCESCAPGTFAATPNAAPSCALCAAGSYASAIGATACVPCPIGDSSTSGASFCTASVDTATGVASSEGTPLGVLVGASAGGLVVLAVGAWLARRHGCCSGDHASSAKVADHHIELESGGPPRPMAKARENNFSAVLPRALS
jgi:hypothetical protein